MKETGKGGVLEAVRLHLGKKPDLALFRNQAGFIDRDAPCKFCGKRPEQCRGAERYGLAPGASDLIGIGPGGRFFALEVKAPGKKPTGDQIRFMELVKKFGGYSGWCDSVESAERCYQEARSMNGFYAKDGSGARRFWPGQSNG